VCLLSRPGKNPRRVLSLGGAGAVVSAAVEAGAGRGANPHVLSAGWKCGNSCPVTRVYRAPMGPPRSSQESVFVDTPSRSALA
jgi:hypothetical protein